MSANAETRTGPTGPRTEAGKAVSSQNALTTGLFAARDFVLPHEQTEYAQTRAGLMSELAPKGILEETFADEVMTATWRLRRCGVLEAALAAADSMNDSMNDDAFEKKQKSIDRARAQAHRILRRSITELRALQTERYIRRDLEISENIGLADSAKILRVCNETPATYEEAAPEPEPEPVSAAKPSRITLRDLENLMTLADKKLCAGVRADNPASSCTTTSAPPRQPAAPARRILEELMGKAA